MTVIRVLRAVLMFAGLMLLLTLPAYGCAGDDVQTAETETTAADEAAGDGAGNGGGGEPQPPPGRDEEQAGPRVREGEPVPWLISEELELAPSDLALLTSPLPAEVEDIDYSAFPDGTEPGRSGTTYYVHADEGRDDNPGTEEAPFVTIDQALEVAGNGDRVLVHGGAYQTDGLEITQSDFLLAAYGDGEVHIPGIPEGASIGLSIDEPGQHDVMVRGLIFDLFPDLGIHLGDTDTIRNVVLESITINRSAEGVAGWVGSEEPIVDGLWVRGLHIIDVETIGYTFGEGPASNVRISGLYVRGSGTGSEDTAADGLAFESGRNVLVENSVVEQVGGDGIDLKAEQVAVLNSVVRHVGRNGVKFWQDGVIQDCLVFDTGADAQLVTESGSYRITGSIFADHLKEGGSAYTATFGFDSPEEELSVEIEDSIFYRQPGPLFLPEGAEVTIRDTVFWGFSDSYVEIGERSLHEEDLGELGEGNRVEDPGFVDPDSDDFARR